MMSGALPKSFSTPHGITGSKDGKIYVTDRRGNRVQVFDQQGKYLAEKVIAPGDVVVGLGVRAGAVDPMRSSSGSTWLTAPITRCGSCAARISRSSASSAAADASSDSSSVPHGMAADAQGNLYVGEASTGRRVQKFTLQRR